MANIEALIRECAQAMTDMVIAAERSGAPMDAIAQALSDAVVAMESIATRDSSQIVAAIKGLSMTVNVSPTPVNVHVPPQQERKFKPLLGRVLTRDARGLIDTFEIIQKDAPSARED